MESSNGCEKGLPSDLPDIEPPPRRDLAFGCLIWTMLLVVMGLAVVMGLWDGED